ncbi:DUF11 domain-containing protein [bacterium]|nr:MAG: DUF11 domain-containing protein [bacterium]
MVEIMAKGNVLMKKRTQHKPRFKLKWNVAFALMLLMNAGEMHEKSINYNNMDDTMLMAFTLAGWNHAGQKELLNITPESFFAPMALASTPVNLSGSTADWFPILNGANFDPYDDTQSNRKDVDLVGNVTDPLIYFHYYDGGTAGEANDSDDVISVRWRLGAEGTGGGTPPRITIYTLVGVDANSDGVLDCFISFDGGAGTKRTEVVGTGTGANDSPSTSSFTYTRNTVNTPYASYNWAVVFASATTYAESTNYDLDADGQTDVLVSTSIPWTHLKNFLAIEKGINITINTLVRYIAVTATQANSLNGDFGGVHDKNGDLNTTWEDLLAFSVPMSISEPFSTIQDSDGDGIADYLDIDDDDDGILDVDETEDNDQDGDTIVNRLDLDSDGDGISDNIEAQSVAAFVAPSGVDTDADGLDNTYDPDNGGTYIVLIDTDGDGLDDYLDLDSDGDGIRDSVEGTADFDGDGIPNYRDTDSDGDGIPDNIEAQSTAAYVAPSGNDTDGDGLDDAYDPDNGGVYIILVDTDSDGKYDYLDIDSDNDGIRDSIELNNNQDGDAQPNFRDTDSDGDGILDNIEAQTVAGYIAASGSDTDGDGLDNAYDPDNGGTYLTPVSTDGDGIADYLDSDSDGDGIRDSVEGTTDFDGDGIPNYRDTDSDNDSISDNVEAQSTSAFVAASGSDTDGDGLDNAYDPNNGGAFIVVVDTDGDGHVDYLDLDSDGDGIRDSVEGTTQTDADGIPNFRDLDSDGDGIPDIIEAQTTAGYINLAGTDTDNDGLDDSFDADNGGTYISPVDTDSDTTPDYLDTDSDNDSLLDVNESGLAALSGTDADNDGLDDSIDSNDATFGPANAGVNNPSVTLSNSDGTGDLDFRSGGYPLSGSVYSDANHNSNREFDETGTGQTLYVKLIQTGVTVDKATVDIVTGIFSFSNVSPGTYSLIVDTNNLDADVTATSPTSWIATERNLQVSSLIVNSYELTGINFGLYNGSKMSYTVFRDNGKSGATAYNAVKEATELGVDAIQIALTTSDELTTIDEQHTNGDGSVTLWIPHTYNGTSVKVISSIPNGTVPVSSNVGTTSGTMDLPNTKLSFTVSSGTSYTGSVLGIVTKSRLEIGMQKESLPGTAVFIPHQFTANSPGSISITTTITPDPNMAGWSAILYTDTNANGVLDSGEGVYSGTSSVITDQVVALILKVSIPSNAPIGGSALVDVDVSHSLSGTSPVVVLDYTNQDKISVNLSSSAGLELVKTTNKATALPGEQITYTVTYTNVSSGSLNTIVIRDATPSYTTFVSVGYGALPNSLTNCVTVSPSVGTSGIITWTFGGVLESGGSGTVTFTVQVEN